MTERTKAENDFIDQYTRKVLVKLADLQVRDLGWTGFIDSKLEVYVEYGREKGWLSKKENKLTSRGFAVATSFLKR